MLNLFESSVKTYIPVSHVCFYFFKSLDELNMFCWCEWGMSFFCLNEFEQGLEGYFESQHLWFDQWENARYVNEKQDLKATWEVEFAKIWVHFCCNCQKQACCFGIKAFPTSCCYGKVITVLKRG